ncbi:O-antigen ligase family protein [Nostoc sp. UHCC 0302]|uniref:O-antigen ligase family protein n=1 Tax=Nostoc sp. UHCC 0302 TaxID=3134896 RepID=UPI00311CCF01
MLKDMINILASLDNSKLAKVNFLQKQSKEFILNRQIQSTKWLFFALCFYLLSQSFTIPIIPIGHWVTWINFSDLATYLLLLTYLINFTQVKFTLSKANKHIFILLIITLLASIISYCGYLSNLIDQNAPGTRLGIYQLYRLVQFVCIFRITAQIPLTQKRLDILSKITNAVLIFVCLSIILTFTGILPLALMTAHLPQDPGTAGPWAFFASPTYIGSGWGSIGYNHAYVAAQVTMLVSLRMHLGIGKQVVLDFCLLFLSTFSCFLSGSRSGFFSLIFFAGIYVLKKPAYLGTVITMTTILFLSTGFIFTSQTIDFENPNTSIIERQATLLDSSNSENLSGRDMIWLENIEFLNKNPIVWILGKGFGGAWDDGGSGGNAHMLLLNVIIENGIIGLLIFLFLFYKILCLLYQHEQKDKAIFWVSISLLIGSFSQETFYPVPALGHFLGLYLCSVAIALRSDID